MNNDWWSAELAAGGSVRHTLQALAQEKMKHMYIWQPSDTKPCLPISYVIENEVHYV